jgi:hypothetical protein
VLPGALISKTRLSLLRSVTGDDSQIPSPSQSTFKSGGLMLKLGQKRSNKLLKGILVFLLLPAVALIRSTTVRIRSRFSGGSCWISDLIAPRRVLEGGRMSWKEGRANVDREGGFRMTGKFLMGGGSTRLLLLSSLMAASK